MARLQGSDEAAVATPGGIAKLLRCVAPRARSSPPQASADELARDTWVVVLVGLRAFEGRSSIKTWIFRILIHRAKTRGAREARTIPVPALDDDASIARPADTPKNLLLRKELAGALAGASAISRSASGWSSCSAMRLGGQVTKCAMSSV